MPTLEDHALPENDATFRRSALFFQQAERMLRQTRALQMVVSLLFYLDGRDRGADPFGKERMGSDDEQRYYRYVIARWAPLDNVRGPYGSIRKLE